MSLKIIRVLAATVPFILVSCQNTGSGGGAPGVRSQSSQYATFKMSLIDAPSAELKEVHVNIDHFEVLIEGQGKKGRVIFGENTGDVDLLQLQNGVRLPLTEMQLPSGLNIQQIRMVLKEDGHYSVKSDNSICQMKTPSAQKTGIKIILTNQFLFEGGFDYNLVLDFDAKKSVVLQGNGGCLLKPVLKLAAATKQVIPPPVIDDGGVNPLPSPEPSPADPVDLNGGTSPTNDPTVGDGYYTVIDPTSGEVIIYPDQIGAYFSAP